LALANLLADHSFRRWLWLTFGVVTTPDGVLQLTFGGSAVSRCAPGDIGAPDDIAMSDQDERTSGLQVTSGLRTTSRCQITTSEHRASS